MQQEDVRVFCPYLRKFCRVLTEPPEHTISSRFTFPQQDFSCDQYSGRSFLPGTGSFQNVTGSVMVACPEMQVLDGSLGTVVDVSKAAHSIVSF